MTVTAHCMRRRAVAFRYDKAETKSKGFIELLTTYVVIVLRRHQCGQLMQINLKLGVNEFGKQCIRRIQARAGTRSTLLLQGLCATTPSVSCTEPCSKTSHA